MADNIFQNIPLDDILDLLAQSTKEYNEAISNKETAERIQIRKEGVEFIQKVIAEKRAEKTQLIWFFHNTNALKTKSRLLRGDFFTILKYKKNPPIESASLANTFRYVQSYFQFLLLLRINPKNI